MLCIIDFNFEGFINWEWYKSYCFKINCMQYVEFVVEMIRLFIYLQVDILQIVVVI